MEQRVSELVWWLPLSVVDGIIMILDSKQSAERICVVLFKQMDGRVGGGWAKEGKNGEGKGIYRQGERVNNSVFECER